MTAPDGHKARTAEQHLQSGHWRASCLCPDGIWVSDWLPSQLDTVHALAVHWRGDEGGTLHPYRCDFFWGSHGCDLPRGHEPATLHTCGSQDEEGPCCQYDESRPPEARIRWSTGDDDDPWRNRWRPYGEGWRP